MVTLFNCFMSLMNRYSPRFLLRYKEIMTSVGSLREFENTIGQVLLDMRHSHVLHHQVQKSKILLLPRGMRNCMNNDRRFNGRIKEPHFGFIECDNHFIFKKNVDEKLFFGWSEKSGADFHRSKTFRSKS